MRILLTIFTLMGILLAPPPAKASYCLLFADDAPRAMRPTLAAFDLKTDQVGIRYIGHSTYEIVTGEGLRIATDWSGEYTLDPLPDVITMNHAHGSHWTPAPDPAIKQALQGWGDADGPARHHLQLGDALIRNVPTNIRGWGGGVEVGGNSIFIFEYEGLCIGHLGHLHHMPTDEQFARIGRLDVVMAPIDGGMTLTITQMIAVLKRFKARIVLPMHAFEYNAVERFLRGMSDDFEIERLEGNELVISINDLPAKPTVMAPRGL